MRRDGGWPSTANVRWIVADSDTRATQRTTRWLERAVVGLDLCPFAGPVLRRDAVRLAVSRVRGVAGAVEEVLGAAVALLEAAPSEVSTTLVIFAQGLEDFEELLEAAAVVVYALEDADAGGLLQLATFHPDYRFDDAPDDDLGNFTNRAPYPILQLLRVDEVGRAIEGHPDTEQIPLHNIERLAAMGRDAVLRLWAEWGEEA